MELRRERDVHRLHHHLTRTHHTADRPHYYNNNNNNNSSETKQLIHINNRYNDQYNIKCRLSVVPLLLLTVRTWSKTSLNPVKDRSSVQHRSNTQHQLLPLLPFHTTFRGISHRYTRPLPFTHQHRSTARGHTTPHTRSIQSNTREATPTNTLRRKPFHPISHPKEMERFRHSFQVRNEHRTALVVL